MSELIYRDVLEFANLQVGYLMKQRGEYFLRQLRRVVNAFISNPHLAPLLNDLRGEHDGIRAAFDKEEEHLARKAVQLKAELVKLDPPSQKWNAIKPKEPGQNLEWFQSSLAAFDEIARGVQFTSVVYPPGRAGHMVAILRRNLERLQYLAPCAKTGQLVRVNQNQRQDLDPLAKRLIEMEGELRHLWETLRNEQESSPAFALVDLERFVSSMLAGPRVDGIDPLAGHAGEQIDKWEANYRVIVERVQQELQLRIGTRRSALALLERFRGRCQWHEREELYKLASDKEERRKPEDRLLRVMARWLYDQGLNPIGQVSAGGLRPDLFDPSRKPAVFIEAKQYRKSPKGQIRRAIRQIDDTAAQFTAEPYLITEAFLAVFRLDGDLAIPQTYVISRGAYTLFVVIIDLKPLASIGSREKVAAVQLTEDDLV